MAAATSCACRVWHVRRRHRRRLLPPRRSRSRCLCRRVSNNTLQRTTCSPLASSLVVSTYPPCRVDHVKRVSRRLGGLDISTHVEAIMSISQVAATCVASTTQTCRDDTANFPDVTKSFLSASCACFSALFTHDAHALPRCSSARAPSSARSESSIHARRIGRKDVRGCGARALTTKVEAHSRP